MKSTTSVLTLTLLGFAACLAMGQATVLAEEIREERSGKSNVSPVVIMNGADKIQEAVEPQGCAYVPGYGWYCT